VIISGKVVLCLRGQGEHALETRPDDHDLWFLFFQEVQVPLRQGSVEIIVGIGQGKLASKFRWATAIPSGYLSIGVDDYVLVIGRTIDIERSKMAFDLDDLAISNALIQRT
jgi:hypothetical protein